ncbi:MAG: hypothetical protein DWQ05_08225 [Calditrichaeota bacterium]|nr:MAG: hypothetical protein DWQ05_08225 [Calditrichota bacterium]
MKGAKKNILILCGSLLAIASAMYGLLIHPQQIKIETLSTDINHLVRMVEAATAEQKEVVTLEYKLKSYEDSLAALERRIFERSEVPNILNKIIQVGRRNRVEFSAMYPRYTHLLASGSEKNQSPLILLPIEMAFHGQFNRVGQFIDALAEQDFLLSLSRLEMAVSPDSYPDIAVVVRGNLYLRRATSRSIKAKM